MHKYGSRRNAHTFGEHKRKIHKLPQRVEQGRKGRVSALMSPRSFSIIYKSEEVLTACNIPLPYLQRQEGREH